MNCDNKKGQFILSLLLIFAITLHYYIIDSKCILFYFMLFAPILMLLPIIWNELLYNELSVRFEKAITYRSFQCILTAVLFLLCIFIFFILVTGYMPSEYKPGQC